jgi:hypothetical protein
MDTRQVAQIGASHGYTTAGLGFQFPTTELGLAKEFYGQSRKGDLLYFHVFACGNEIFGPKK